MGTAEKEKETTQASASHTGTIWGPKLFWATLVVVLVFFWWLLIYSHGVEIQHG
jgi:hypothetical protein